MRAHGYEDVGTSSATSTTSTASAPSATRRSPSIKAATDALTARTSWPKGKSALTGDSPRPARQLYENNGGRWLSIEANADGPTHRHGTRHATPARPSWPRSYDAAGNRIGNTPTVGYLQRPTSARYYQYHAPSGSAKGRGGAAAGGVEVASSNGNVDTVAVKEWIAKNPP